jgi:serine/threonine protein kinase
MGEVYRARDPRLGRDVAIKVSAERFTGYFEREARVIAALSHPNICTLYDIGPNYLVMEFIDGSPLHGPLPMEEAVRRGIQIAAALEEAHAKHILHRDLKPANILVTPQGALKLLDFGLAKLVEDSDETQTMAVMGTPFYMSPEQAEGKPLDQRSDVFSFGAVLYEILTGVRAFDSLSAVLGTEPKAFDAPPELRQIAMKCLRKSPVDRFQSIREVRAALESFAAKPLDEQPSIASCRSRI